MEKDFSLLRPFDLGAAKRGEAIFYLDEQVEFLGLSTVKATRDGERLLRVECQHGLAYICWEEAKMAPLAWVEGRPVYPGDVLYWQPEHRMFVSRAVEHDCWNEWIIATDGCNYLTENLTWTPPKVKRDGWVNVYPGTKAMAVCSDIWPSKKDCDEYQRENRIACVRIEWEEPAGQEGCAK